MFLLQIKGVSKITKSIKTSNTADKFRYKARLTRAALFLQRESMKIVPVDKGNLKGSAFTRVFGTGFSTNAAVGYTAAYAPYVHENPDAAHGADFNKKHAVEIAAGTMSNRGENQQYKFLEKPAKQHRRKILKMIAGR